MKPKQCPVCKTWLSCDNNEWYCTECAYVDPTPLVKSKWSLDDE